VLTQTRYGSIPSHRGNTFDEGLSMQDDSSVGFAFMLLLAFLLAAGASILLAFFGMRLYQWWTRHRRQG
jgi:hypothetical protein